MADIKQPTDRKTKATRFTFDHEGKTYTLPLASEGAANVPGQVTRDAIMSDDEMIQMRLGFALLEACGADADAVAAVYAKSTADMTALLAAWMHHGDGLGATVPQS